MIKGYYTMMLASVDSKCLSPSLPTTHSTRPISSPLTSTLHDIDKVLRNHPVGLLTRMQLVEPQEAIRTRVRHAVATRKVTVVNEPRHV